MMRTAPGGGRRPVWAVPARRHRIRETVRFRSGGSTSSQAAWALAGRRLEPSASTSTKSAAYCQLGKSGRSVCPPGYRTRRRGMGLWAKALTQLRCGGGEGTPVRAHDVGGGGHQHRAAVGQFLCQHRAARRSCRRCRSPRSGRDESPAVPIIPCLSPPFIPIVPQKFPAVNLLTRGCLWC